MHGHQPLTGPTYRFADDLTAAAGCARVPRRRQNGNETDVDCGGGGCAACATGEHCSTNNDCMSMLCNSASGICVGTQLRGRRQGRHRDRHRLRRRHLRACAEGRAVQDQHRLPQQHLQHQHDTCVGIALLRRHPATAWRPTPTAAAPPARTASAARRADGDSDCFSGVCSAAPHLRRVDLRRTAPRIRARPTSTAAAPTAPAAA